MITWEQIELAVLRARNKANHVDPEAFRTLDRLAHELYIMGQQHKEDRDGNAGTGRGH